LFGNLWEVDLTYRYIFAFKFTLRSQQPDIVPIICHRCIDNGGKFAASVVDTGTTIAKLVAKFAAGVIRTGCKFAASVIDTGAHLDLTNISAQSKGS
jgi:hypothetical protein